MSGIAKLIDTMQTVARPGGRSSHAIAHTTCVDVELFHLDRRSVTLVQLVLVNKRSLLLTCQEYTKKEKTSGKPHTPARLQRMLFPDWKDPLKPQIP
jgi:hypothetical protein